MKLSQCRLFYAHVKISSIHLKDRLTDESYTKPCKEPEWRPFDIPCIIRAMVVRNLESRFVSDFSLHKICTLLNYDFDIASSNYNRFFQDDQWCITHCKLSFLLRKRVRAELGLSIPSQIWRGQRCWHTYIGPLSSRGRKMFRRCQVNKPQGPSSWKCVHASATTDSAGKHVRHGKNESPQCQACQSFNSIQLTPRVGWIESFLSRGLNCLNWLNQYCNGCN